MKRLLAFLTPTLAFLLLLLPATVQGQSLLSAGGLGIPVEGLDARSRGMGSFGVGLFGSYVIPGDPTAALGIPLPTITASLQPMSNTIGQGGSESRASGTRFPLVGVGYPIGDRSVATITFGSYLDQRWRTSTQRTLALAGEDVLITDSFESDGGIQSVRVGYARRVTNSLSLALAAGAYTGQVERVFSRTFDDISVGAEVEPFVVEGRWRMRAPTATISGQWNQGDFLRLAGSATWAGDLRAEPSGDAEGPSRDFDLPIEYRLGGSAILTPRVAVNLGMSYADWSGTGDALEEGSARAAWAVGGGAEWEGARVRGRNLPVRLGYRRSDLPFSFQGEFSSESIFAGGLGLTLAQTQNIPLARFDLSVERGNRDAGPTTEQFWRTTFSLRLSGG